MLPLPTRGQNGPDRACRSSVAKAVARRIATPGVFAPPAA